MTDDYHKLLLESDDEGWEVPNNDWAAHPYDELCLQIVAIQRRLRDELGLNLERDGNVQDASFIDELYIRPPNPDAAMPLAIRFSNFGKLFTVCSTSGEFSLNQIVAMIQELGWRYVPAEILDAPYDGAHQEFHDEGFTWWFRFFDYT